MMFKITLTCAVLWAFARANFHALERRDSKLVVAFWAALYLVTTLGLVAGSIALIWTTHLHHR
jgi:hypothetical protein